MNATSLPVTVAIPGFTATTSGLANEFRDWVDNNDEPIEQETKFRRLPLTVALRYYLTDRGRAVSQFAYIPNRYAPYVGVGGGAKNSPDGGIGVALVNAPSVPSPSRVSPS